jgi:hypothetical protein
MKEHMAVFQKILGKDHKTRPLYYLPSPIFLLQLNHKWQKFILITNFFLYCLQQLGALMQK